MLKNLSDLFNDTTRMVAVAATAALTILALFLAVMTLDALARLGDSPYASEHVITVTGTGTASQAPTIARVNFTVQETAESVEAAQNAATERAENALRTLRDLGIESEDIRTSGYNVFPQYESELCIPGQPCRSGPGRIIGYQVSQSVDITVRNPDMAGDVLAALGSAGVQNISGPNFEVDDDAEVLASARADAIEDAHRKARELARQLDVRLGNVISFQESGGAIPYAGKAMMDMMDESRVVTPSLPQGENESQVLVTITYEIR